MLKSITHTGATNPAGISKPVTEVPLSSSVSKDDVAYHRLVVRKLLLLEYLLQAMQQKQTNLENNLKLILDSGIELRTSNNDEAIGAIDVWHNLLLANSLSLSEVEMQLNNDENYRMKMVNELSRIGGKNLRSFVIKVMRHTFSNELAVYYSWVGGKKKKLFSELNMCKVILAAARHNYRTCTDEKISDSIKAWLAHAKERCSRKNVQNDEILE